MNKHGTQFYSSAETHADTGSPRHHHRHEWGHDNGNGVLVPVSFLLGLALLCFLWLAFCRTFNDTRWENSGRPPWINDDPPFVKDGTFEQQGYALTNLAR
jgi:hypothetical protein